MPTVEQITPYTPYIIMAVNGLIAGWLAGLLLGGGGLIRNLIVGIIGAFVAVPWFAWTCSSCRRRSATSRPPYPTARRS